MAYKKKVVKKTSPAPTANPLVGGLLGQFLGGYGTNLLGASGGPTKTVTKFFKKGK